MVVLIDPPRWPAHDRLWSHLVSDTSVEELHAFAAGAGIPARGFEGDHYDVPEERYADLVAAGAQPVPGRELLERLVAAGLRVPKRRGEKVLRSAQSSRWLAEAGPNRLDLVASSLPVPAEDVVATRVLLQDGEGRFLVVPVAGSARWGLPDLASLARPDGEPALRALGYQRLRLLDHASSGGSRRGSWSFLVVLAGTGSGRVPAGVTGHWCEQDRLVDLLGHRSWWPLVEHSVRSGFR